MQQTGVAVPLASHQLPWHPHRAYNAGGGRSIASHLVIPHGQACIRQQQVKICSRTSGCLQAATTMDMNQGSNIRKDKYFEVEMKVHETELDQYGVVNNTIYNNYIQNGRDKLLESLDISLDWVASTGNAMALSELHLKYSAPLRNGDMFVVKSRLVQIKGVRVIFEHIIETLPDHKLIVEAQGTAVCLDKAYRITRVFPELSTKLLQLFSSKDD